MTGRRATLLLVASLAGLLLAGCAASTDGTPQSQTRTTATSPDGTSPSVADPFDSAGPPAEGSGGPADASTIDACSLVTKAEADEVTGVTVLPAQRSVESCTFPTPTSGAVGQLEIFVGDGAKQYYDDDKIVLDHKFTNVPNVGDEAHLEDGAIFFRAKGIWFALSVTRLDDTNIGPMLAKIAAAVVSRAG